MTTETNTTVPDLVAFDKEAAGLTVLDTVAISELLQAMVAGVISMPDALAKALAHSANIPGAIELRQAQGILPAFDAHQAAGTEPAGAAAAMSCAQEAAKVDTSLIKPPASIRNV